MSVSFRGSGINDPPQRLHSRRNATFEITNGSGQFSVTAKLDLVRLKADATGSAGAGTEEPFKLLLHLGDVHRYSAL
jgi:hypothetical protein